MPSLIALRQRLKDRTDIAFAFVSLDQDANAVTALMQQRDWHMPVYMPTTPLPSEFKTDGIPATFLLDPQGRISRRVVGSENWDTDRWETELRKLAPAPKEAAKP